MSWEDALKRAIGLSTQEPTWTESKSLPKGPWRPWFWHNDLILGLVIAAIFFAFVLLNAFLLDHFPSLAVMH